MAPNSYRRLLSYLLVFRARATIMEIQQNWNECNKFRVHLVIWGGIDPVTKIGMVCLKVSGLFGILIIYLTLSLHLAI